MHILVTGSTGLLGSSLCRLLSVSHEVTGLARYPSAGTPWKSIAGDITNPRLLPEVKPDAVIHTAAMTDLALAESGHAAADLINVTGTRNVLEKYPQARFALISTDGVFDGIWGGFTEEDAPSPLNYYAKTKVAAEALVPYNGLIIRLTFYGHSQYGKRGSYSDWLLDQLAAGSTVHASTRRIFNPLVSSNAGEAISELLTGGRRGIFHLGAPDAVSRFEFCRLLARRCGYNADLVQEITDEESSIPRPLNTSLDCSKARSILKTRLLSVSEGIDRLFEERPK